MTFLSAGEDESLSKDDAASFAISISNASMAWEVSNDESSEAARKKNKGIFSSYLFKW